MDSANGQTEIIVLRVVNLGNGSMTSVRFEIGCGGAIRLQHRLSGLDGVNVSSPYVLEAASA